MLKIVTKDFLNAHRLDVEEAVDWLSQQGYEVYQIKRIKKLWFSLFGTNVTHIYYKIPECV